jgi:outer membrane murein-binding lipoprotein Lpp
MSPAYPNEYSSDQIRSELSTLSTKIDQYSARGGLIDDLLKDAVRFTLGSNELQHREGRVVARISIGIALIATAATVVSCFSAKTSERLYAVTLQTIETLDRRLDRTDSLRAEVNRLESKLDSLRLEVSRAPRSSRANR